MSASVGFEISDTNNDGRAEAPGSLGVSSHGHGLPSTKFRVSNARTQRRSSDSFSGLPRIVSKSFRCSRIAIAAAAPSALQRALSRLVASPRTFNVVVSNIPGPQEPLWMLGCQLREAFPMVPLADRHALSIGVTTVGEGAFFGLYADPQSLPEVDGLADEIDLALERHDSRARRRVTTGDLPR